MAEYGQGGPCSDDGDGWTYENGYLFADATEAFVVETAGVHRWAAERVEPGSARNISNGLCAPQRPQPREACIERASCAELKHQAAIGAISGILKGERFTIQTFSCIF